MRNIEKSIKLAQDLYKDKIISRDFFSQKLEDIKALADNSQKYFNEYLFDQIKIPHVKKAVDLDKIKHSNTKILILEIGGTKTTIQSFEIKSKDKIEINPTSSVLAVPTLKNETGLKDITSNNFFKWIAQLIKYNLHDCTKVGINIAALVDSKGFLLKTPPNISVEDISKRNLQNELKKILGNMDIKIFNDVESVTAIQLLDKNISSHPFYIDINGTGNNSAIFTSSGFIQSLEAGHTECVEYNKKLNELETAVGGRLGIEKNFNDIAIKKRFIKNPLNAYEIQNLYVQDIAPTLSKLSYLIYQRAFLYKAVSFICIDKFCKTNKLNTSDVSKFILFGGINKIKDSQKGIHSYLKFFESNIEISYTEFGEDAGRYGCALLSMASL